MLRQHYEVLIIVSNGYPSAKGRLPTRYSPVRRFPLYKSAEASVQRFSLDLHVLGTPPAFILSQDQTLNIWYMKNFSFLISKSFLFRIRISRFDSSVESSFCLLNCTGTNFAFASFVSFVLSCEILSCSLRSRFIS